MIGININCKTQNFAWQILSGLKTIETRSTPSLDHYIGQRVGIIRTGCGTPMLVGYMTIVGRKTYGSIAEFRNDEHKHFVKAGSKYDFKTVKYGYEIAEVERIEPREITTRGIVGRKIS